MIMDDIVIAMIQSSQYSTWLPFSTREVRLTSWLTSTGRLDRPAWDTLD